MYSDRINCYHPGWRSPPDVYGPAKSTVRNSVEEISLHSDVIEHFSHAPQRGGISRTPV